MQIQVQIWILIERESFDNVTAPVEVVRRFSYSCFVSFPLDVHIQLS